MREPWTDESIARLRRMCANGASYSVAAEALGRTRNAIAGKAQALGLVFRGGGVRPKHSAETRAKISAMARARRARRSVGLL